jgi:hypothetical protein
VSHDVFLPELVLVGDQSAGKSSLMSGLAWLNLPRSAGVCTRCPIHIRVSDSPVGQWSCRVSLQRDYAFRPPTDRLVAVHDVSSSNPFPPWVKQPRVTKEFMTIYEKSQIEDVLRWAQVAILNDQKDHKMFMPASSYAKEVGLTKAAEETAAKFSPNVVALEIKGPDLPDLSFYDMPGIYQFDDEEQYLVNVVRNLAKEYISHPRAIIIWAVPMNADPQTSATYKMIRDMKALDRTIGVMTKADLLPSSGSHRQWLEMLRGERHPLGLGYFVTSRRPDLSLDDVQRWEESFFSDVTTDGQDQWPPEFSTFVEKCGVERLKSYLSEKLGQEFGERYRRFPFVLYLEYKANSPPVSHLSRTRSRPSWVM